MKVGIVGCGFIGTELSKFIDENNDFKLIGLNDIDKSKVDILIKNLNQKPKLMETDELIHKSELIIESASTEAVEKILKSKNLDKKHKKLLVMSTGGLIKDPNLLNKIKNCLILLPSGAISGLDAIKSVVGKIKSLRLTTTKPIRGLESAPHITKNRINLKNLKNKKVIFEGNLKEAIIGFPKNINVAATLYLASKFDDMQVKIIADPTAIYNTHEIEVIGDFGKIKTTTNNLPSENPRTSYLALLSAINILKNMKNNIKIGN